MCVCVVNRTNIMWFLGHIPLRLTHGSHGYLEIYYNGHWGYVCHNSSQSSYQFNSVCRILGYSSYVFLLRTYTMYTIKLITYFCKTSNSHLKRTFYLLSNSIGNLSLCILVISVESSSNVS